eukprot:g13059.t1
MWYEMCTRLAPVVVVVTLLAELHISTAFFSPHPTRVLTGGSSRLGGQALAARPRRQRTNLLLFQKRPEERALGDVMIPEDASRGAGDGTGGGGGIGISAEPPGFLKRLFSVPKNVRRTAAAGDVVVPVIGARDGWGGIRQRLANQGIYPGVEYRILEVSVFPTIPASPTTTAAAGAAEVGSAPPYASPAFEQPEQQQQQQQQQQQRADLDAEPTSLLASARDSPEGSFDDGGLVYTMRPIYPLVSRLERDDWPVLVPAREFPVMLTPFSYNAATAWAALTTSLSLLAVGFVASQALTFSVINSHSMEPTLQVGDVILVEKVSRSAVVRRNDVVFFTPPPALREVVASAGGALNPSDLFVKRVAGLPGDTVTVNADGRVDVVPRSGRPTAPGTGGTPVNSGDALAAASGGERGAAKAAPLPDSVLQRIARVDEKVLDGAFVLGDNPAASMDSRVWGQLDEGEIVGHALLRVLPPPTLSRVLSVHGARMASLADNEENSGVGDAVANGSGVDGGSGGGAVGSVGYSDVQEAAAAVYQTGSDVPEHVVYNCRMCRRAVFNAADIQSHEVAQHNFHRRKSKGVTSKGLCSSIFLAEPKRWMKQQLGEMEGKLSCPNKSCGARLGSLKWTGAQCSCGSWVTPAIQFPRKNLDARSRVAAGPPPGTVLHPSLRVSNGAAIAADSAASSSNDAVAGGSDGAGAGGGAAVGSVEDSDKRPVMYFAKRRTPAG